MTTLRLSVLLLMFVGCRRDAADGLEPNDGLPTDLHVVGTAAGPRGDGGLIECDFEVLVSLTEFRRTAAFIEYEGTMGGEARRLTVDSTGAGFEFWADIGWPNVMARLVRPDSIELLLGDTTIADSRFWREMAFFAGTRRPDDPGSGSWACAPLDIYQGGHVDTIGVVRGEWHIEAPSPE